MLKIGAGTGFSGDRIEPAVQLAEEADLDYLILECLAERTIAIAQKNKLHDESLGYDPLLEKRIRALLPSLKKKNVRLITNMGAANPESAAEKILEIAKELEINVKVAAVTGDDVLKEIDQQQSIMEEDRLISDFAPIISANAYLGVEALLPALKTDADIIVTGRVADPSLFLAPMVHHYNWSLEDYNKIAQGSLIGHLLECAGQITGGYFGDNRKKSVPDIANLGFPYAIVEEDGTTTITKPENTGGLVSKATVKEQLLYEVTDPAEYITPDIIADFSHVRLEETGPDKIKVTGGIGRAKPEKLKVAMGYHAGFLGEGEISYAGSTGLERAELAGEILKERLLSDFPDLRIDFMGVSSVHRTSFTDAVPYEVRLRAAATSTNKEEADRIGQEIEALYTNGPYGGGGARKRTTEVIGVVSTLISRDKIKLETKVKGSE
ncbi:acyclic terpene utilization AtuA family protein [Evansella clarkii]|uniref:acyclic terpene utilization AtuA family protein n=1 Tax=Evansella clarkii TaxID=79879 RepID=UPI000B4316F6|nr:acyclic terpene utilization AtuA family protein [Evansella clarkii]